MQIFEVVELTEFPFMETREIVEGTIVSDIINDTSAEKVFLLVDHDTKSIWTFNGLKSILKIQVYGGILAGKLRQQLKLFYRVYPLNTYSKTDNNFQKIMEKQLGPGRAKPIEKKDFVEKTIDRYQTPNTIQNPNILKAIEYINNIPQPDNLIRRFMIIAGQIFTEEEVTESFIKEEKRSIQPVKLGRLNNGFTFFRDLNYSTRLVIKERQIQGIELYINKDDKSPPLELIIPIIDEKKFSNHGSIEALVNAFKIPEQLTKEEKDKANIPDNDSSNKS
ncbi:MAG: hypothetical protein ACFFEN_02685 [Candidatus Thorarchaeota archaeon]